MPTVRITKMDDIFNKDANLPIVQLRRGDVLEGTVVHVDETGGLVDVGAKTEGILPQAEVKGQNLKVGEKVIVYVLTPEDRRRGQLVLSLSKAEAVKSWIDLERSLKENETLDAKVTGHNKGGYIVDVVGLVGFIPFSHIEDAPNMTMEEAKLQSFLDKTIDRELKVRVIELDKEKNRIILSEREAKLGEGIEKRQAKVSKLKEGAIVKGNITAIMPYGLMMEVEAGVEGLVPLEEIGWDEEAVEEALSSFSVGVSIEAKVIEVDKELAKIRLSVKQISTDPWKDLVAGYKVGDNAMVKVNKITSYGVFAELGGIEGMIGISSIPDDLDLSVGTEISVRIDKLDPVSKRLDLSYSK